MDLDMGKCVRAVNPTLLPYMEKHRIYELFYDIGEALAMAMPHDHVLFVRKLLMDLDEVRGKTRILLITPPQIRSAELAELIQNGTEMRVVTLHELSKGEKITSEELALRFNAIASDESLDKKGWIICDFPRDAEEAKFLQKHRILPTHTFEICPSHNKYSPKDAWCENVSKWSPDDLKKASDDYRRRVFGLRYVLTSTYTPVPVEGRTLKELALEIKRLSRTPFSKGAPMLPRVLLIGTRGSKRRTLARDLMRNLNLVHIDLEELMTGCIYADNKEGCELRRLKEIQVRIPFKTIITIIKRRLEHLDCRRNGWVITGFPRNLGDLVELDNISTPPNRVIFLSVDESAALKRLANRRINLYNGKIMTTKEIRGDPFEDIDEYATHPRDNEVNVIEEQKNFNENVNEMLSYCGENCYILDGSEPEDVLGARLMKIVTQPWPIVEARRITHPVENKSEMFTLVEDDDLGLSGKRYSEFEKKNIYFDDDIDCLK